MTSSPHEIEAQAALWVVRQQRGPLAAEEQRELDRWLEADHRHRGAYLRTSAAWIDLDRLAALGAGHAVESDERPSGNAQKPSSRRYFLAASVATVTAAGAGAWWWQRIHASSYASDVGEVRRVSLADGSQMVLNTATNVTVRMDETRRDIRLDRGEGLFEVAKDPVRPFVVHTGLISVRAVGTVFAVRAVDGRVHVTVTEGVVELVDNARPGRVIRRIEANEYATVTKQREVDVHPLKREQARRRLLWQEGMVDFAGDPLSEAVAEMNRHNRRQIVIDDAALAARPVVGLFRANDPDNFAATVAIAMGVRSVREDDIIHLRAHPTL